MKISNGIKISGATIVRNIEKFKYPAVESIKSILSICDEFVVNIGNSEDETKKKIEFINSDKIKILETVWDDSNRKDGRELSRQTNIALSKCSGDWIFYIQADEVFSEWDLKKMAETIEKVNDNSKIEGVAVEYLHFYGSYSTVQKARNWYKYEVRVIRNGIGAESHGDAQGFRIKGRKIRAAISECKMFHYGWARSPEIMSRKVMDFHRWWHSDEEIRKRYADRSVFEYYRDIANIVDYEGPHPALMKDKIDVRLKSLVLELKRKYINTRGFLQKLKDISRRYGKGHINFHTIKKW